MIYIYIFIPFAIVYILLRMLSNKRVVNVPVVFAGEQDRDVLIQKVTESGNKPIFKVGDELVDLSKFQRYVVNGNSLAPLSINNGDSLYVQGIKFDIKQIEECRRNLIERIVVLKIDNNRTRQENNEKREWVDGGLKARKVIAVIENNLNGEKFKETITSILEQDKEIDGDKIDDYKNRIEQKYNFVCDFYKDNNFSFFLMSLTYRHGIEKDFSFHSPAFLSGIVEYKS